MSLIGPPSVGTESQVAEPRVIEEGGAVERNPATAVAVVEASGAALVEPVVGAEGLVPPRPTRPPRGKPVSRPTTVWPAKEEKTVTIRGNESIQCQREMFFTEVFRPYSRTDGMGTLDRGDWNPNLIPQQGPWKREVDRPSWIDRAG